LFQDLPSAPPFQVGECILVRIPVPLQIDERLDLDPEILTWGLPPTSMGKSPQRFVFIFAAEIVTSGWLLTVFPIISLSREGYHQLSDTAKETVIPLSAFTHQHLSPALFGDPLTMSDYSTPRPSFLHLVPHTFVINDDRQVRTFFDLSTTMFLIIHTSSSKR
jgi:hypothetical protein